MDDRSNILLSGTSKSKPSNNSGSARNSKWALVSAGAGMATVVGLVASLAFLSLGFDGAAIAAASLHLLFPVAIVSGHVAVRHIRKNDAALKGMGLALTGLNVGYFNLAIFVVVALRYYQAGSI